MVEGPLEVSEKFLWGAGVVCIVGIGNDQFERGEGMRRERRGENIRGEERGERRGGERTWSWIPE